MTVTREELKTRMLENVSDDYDKSEGSFFYDAISPVAIELEDSYTEQDGILKNAFADTATGEYLDKKCGEMGVVRKSATKAIGVVEISGAVGASIAIGNLVASSVATFSVTENKIIGATGKESVTVECTQFGTIGNVPSNTIKFFPVTLEGVVSVINTLPFANGYDAETDESLRQRYFEKINMPATSGNSFHYKSWAKAVVGVGDAKIFPLWNGNGTVKVVICNSNKRAADSQLISDTASYIETQRPIGATVTVASATEKSINITATIVLGNGRTLEQVKTDFEKAVADYFKEIAFVGTYVSYAKIGNILYDVYGVADYSNLKINIGIANIMLAETEIPVLGTVVLS